MIVTIHQPNFFPWWPFFEKMRAADVLVILTHCQWEKGGYQNRFEYCGKWFTMPVTRGLEPIRKKRYLSPQYYWGKIKGNIYRGWRRLDQFDMLIGSEVWKTNSAIIERIARQLDIETEIQYDYPTKLTGTARLVDICKRAGATQYLSGPSGMKYLDEKMFTEAGIKVTYHVPRRKDPIIDAIQPRGVVN